MKYLLSIGMLLGIACAIGLACGGTFVYTLDDPYIHLALAKGIHGGHYGINPQEFSSPSSSILWPFLLASFPAGRLMEWAPLMINALACVLSIGVLSRLFSHHGDHRWGMLWATLIGLGLNWFGLVFTGMEHSLQVLLCVIVAHRLCRRQFDAVLYTALILLPLVRYECLAITAPLSAYLFLEGKRREGLWVIGLALAAMAAFSAFLWSHGLPLLPSSVLAKAPFRPLGAARLLLENLGAHGPTFVMVAALGVLMSQRRLWVLCVLVPALLVVVMGRVGWFGRYEVFLFSYLIAFLIDALATANWFAEGRRRGWLAAGGMALAFPGLLLCTVLTPIAARNVAQQQMLTAQVASMLDRPVAVNDLGLVALRSKHYVLDLWGLGSAEALKARRADDHKEGAWIEHMMASKQVEYAFVYGDWFPQHPSSWIKVGEINTPPPVICLAGSTVSLYAVGAKAVEPLRAALHQAQSQSAAGLITIVSAGDIRSAANHINP